MIKPAKFKFEVNQPDTDAEKQAREKIIDAQTVLNHDFQLVRRCPAKGENMFRRNDRVTEAVIFQAEFDQRVVQHRPFFQTKARAYRAGGDIADNNLNRNNLQFADKLFAVIQAGDEMMRYA